MKKTTKEKLEKNIIKHSEELDKKLVSMEEAAKKGNFYISDKEELERIKKNRHREQKKKIYDSVVHMDKSRRIDLFVKINVVLLAAVLLVSSLIFQLRIDVEDYSDGILLCVLSTLSGIIFSVVTLYFGSIYASYAFLIVFFAMVIFNPESAYLCSGYLGIILITDAAEKRGYLTVKIKPVLTFLTYFIYSFCVYLVLYGFLENHFSSYGVEKGFIEVFAMALPQSVLIPVVVRLIEKFTPKKIVDFLNRYSSRRLSLFAEKDEFEHAFSGKLVNRISVIVIVVTSVVGICAIIFSNILLSTMGSALTVELYNSSRQRVYSSGDDDTETEAAPFRPTSDSETETTIVTETDTIVSAETIISSDSTGTSSYSHTVYFNFSLNGIIYDIKVIIMLSCVAFPLGLICNRYAIRRIAVPISRLSRGMQRFTKNSKAERKKYAEKIYALDIKTQDDIEDLYRAICSMVSEVTNYIDFIEKEQKLQNEIEIANRANEAKSNFLSSMSHEIRTPLNAILGMDEMILRETNEEEILKYAASIQVSGNTLLALINDVLDFSRIEAGKLEIINVEYDLSSVINNLVNTISDKVLKKELLLNVNVDKNIPNVLYGDEIRIKQVILNVLNNAVKYTEKGSVSFNVTYENAEDDYIILTVHIVDTGIGIKAEEKEKLFKPFERIDEERNRTIEGTGLGMSITKKLLSMMDSELNVESEYGKGSDFYFKVKQKVVDYKPIGNFIERYEESVRNMNRYKESFRAPDANILVVDDTAMNLTVIKGLLKNTLVNIDTCENGFEMLDKVLINKYDCIFLDHRMPNMDGMETLAKFKELANNKNSDTPVVVLTANAVSGARKNYIAAGFSDYLTKPIQTEKLEDLLIKYIPGDKIFLTNDFDDSVADDVNNFNESENDFIKKFKHIEGINYKEALINCGNESVLYDVVTSFVENIKEKSELIEKYEKESDIKNYSIYVHALKSSARLIGAMELSGMAMYLEECGNLGIISEIRENTPKLLMKYRDFYDKLLSVIKKDENPDELEQISDNDLNDAYNAILELVTADDFDSAREVVTQLEIYKIPDNQKEKYEKIKEMLKCVNREGIIDTLK